MPQFAINENNAKDAIAKIHFSKDERFTEILGGLCVEAKTFINIDTIDNNFITVSGDDDGFTSKNLESFACFHNSDETGAGEHGAGMRAAFNFFLKEYRGDIQDFGIVSHNKKTGWKFIKMFISDNLITNNFSMYYDCIEPNDIQKCLFTKYIQNDFGTMFIVPNIFENFELYNCIQNIKKLINKRIFYDNLQFIYNNEHITLDKPLIPKGIEHNYQQFNISCFKGQIIKNNKPSPGIKNFYKFTDNQLNLDPNKYYDTDGNTYTDLKLDQIPISVINCECSNLKSKIISPTHEKDYDISNFQHDIGLWIMRNNIIINRKPFGYNKRGISEDNKCPQILFEEIDGDKICQTQINKSYLTTNCLKNNFRGLFKFIRLKYEKYIDKMLENSGTLKKRGRIKNKVNSSEQSDNHDVVNQAVIPPVNQAVIPPVNQAVVPPVNQDVVPPVNQDVVPPVNQTVIPPVNQPDLELVDTYNRFSQDMWKEIFYDQYEIKCLICNKICNKSNPIECCHIKSSKNRGDAIKENGVMACKNCNRSMSGRNMLEWVRLSYGSNSETYNNLETYLKSNNKYLD